MSGYAIFFVTPGIQGTGRRDDGSVAALSFKEEVSSLCQNKNRSTTRARP